MALSGKQIVVPLAHENVRTRLSLLSPPREAFRLSSTPSSELYRLQRTLYEEGEWWKNASLYLVMVIEVKDARSRKQGVVTRSACHFLGDPRVPPSLPRHVEQSSFHTGHPSLAEHLNSSHHALFLQLLRSRSLCVLGASIALLLLLVASALQRPLQRSRAAPADFVRGAPAEEPDYCTFSGSCSS